MAAEFGACLDALAGSDWERAAWDCLIGQRGLLLAFVLQTGQTTVTVTVSAAPSASTLRHPLAKRCVSPPHVGHITALG